MRRGRNLERGGAIGRGEVEKGRGVGRGEVENIDRGEIG